MFSTGKRGLPISLHMPFLVTAVIKRGCIFGKDCHKVNAYFTTVPTNSYLPLTAKKMHTKFPLWGNRSLSTLS